MNKRTVIIILLVFSIIALLLTQKYYNTKMSLEEYLLSIEKLYEEANQRYRMKISPYESIDNMTSEELRIYIITSHSSVKDLRDGIQNLSPPTLVFEYHKNMLFGLDNMLRDLFKLTIKADNIMREEQFESLYNEFYEVYYMGKFEGSELIINSCKKLQDYADENNIYVRLQCRG